MTNEDAVALTESASATELVVIHKVDGALVKGILEWDGDTGHLVPPSPMPQVLRVRSEISGESFLIEASETKAVFFVKGHEGTLDHDEVKFFSDIAATDLWIRIHFADGEVLEGRTHNDTRLLLDSGVWLRPFDSTGNNVLVYVPKSSVVEFHVMGVAIHRPHSLGCSPS
jgi:Family of unknown function (DUF6982)